MSVSYCHPASAERKHKINYISLLTHHLHSMSLTIMSPILLNHTTHNTKAIILVSLPRLESSLRYSSFGEFLLRSARRKIFLHSQLIYMVDYFPYTTRACCCVRETWRVPLSLCQLVSGKSSNLTVTFGNSSKLLLTLSTHFIGECIE